MEFYDGWMYFFGAWKSQQPFTAIKKLGRARIFFLYNSDCICLKEKGHIHLGCLEGEYIMG